MRRAIPALVLAVLMMSACDRPPSAFGEANNIIVLAQNPLWEAVSDTVIQALEPRIFTVRQERTFQMTQIDPTDPKWRRLRQFRQILLFGRAGDPWIQEAAAEAGIEVPAPPAIFEAEDVWVNNQIVTAVVLPDEGSAVALRSLLPELQERYADFFRSYVQRRMYVSGVNEQIADSLARNAGFAIALPDIYQMTAPQPDVFVFRDRATGERNLQRTIIASWREGRPRAMSPDEILAWRDTLTERDFGEPIVTLRENLRIDTVTTAAGPAVEIQGAWERDFEIGEFPGGGPFITRITYCPRQNRTYLLDATLYAPGKEKFEYMLQLWTILNTFSCGEA